MKSLIAKVLIGGSLFTGLGFIACENKRDNANEYEAIPTETTADHSDMTTTETRDSTSMREGTSNDPVLGNNQANTTTNNNQDNANTNNNINNDIIDTVNVKR